MKLNSKEKNICDDFEDEYGHKNKCEITFLDESNDFYLN